MSDACRHCGQPIQRCDDTYVGHHCNGWRHRYGPWAWFHACDPRDMGFTPGFFHAEPQSPPPQ